MGDGTLKVEACADNVIRVAYAKNESFFTRTSITTAAKQCVPTAATLSKDGEITKLATAKLTGADRRQDRRGHLHGSRR